MTEMENMLFRKAVPLILESLSEDKGKIQSQISRETYLTYSHLCNIIKKLDDQGLVLRSINGRKKIATLTKKGANLVLLIAKIKTLMNS